METVWPNLKTLHPPMSQDQFRILRDIIYENSGIYFADQKLYLLEGRLSKRLKELELDSFDKYLRYLQNPQNRDKELLHIYNLVTINETYFFRYEKQLNGFMQQLISEVLKQKKAQNQSVKIWSAGCSSGEEPYTLAMLLREHLNGQLFTTPIEIKATDISHRILEKARSGIYSQNSFRSNNKLLLQSKYFIKEDKHFRLRDDIRKMVRFEYFNLRDTFRMRQFRGQDFIFCRNVLIYFDDIMKKKIIRTFYDVLNHGGYLFVGEAESLHGISSAFRVVHFQGAFCYRKE